MENPELRMKERLSRVIQRKQGGGFGNPLPQVQATRENQYYAGQHEEQYPSVQKPHYQNFIEFLLHLIPKFLQAV
jgi:hypothetical protein